MLKQEGTVKRCDLNLRIKYLGLETEIYQLDTFQFVIVCNNYKESLEELSKDFMCDYDEAGSIGKRYRREDEIGTPYCITVDFETLEDNMVTIRDRDTMEQIRIEISQVKEWLNNKLVF